MIKLGCDESLPSRWKWAKANDVMDVRDGTHDSPKYIDSGIPLVTSKNLRNGEIDFSSCQFITPEDHAAISKRSAVDEGDILYAMIGTIGSPVIVKKDRAFSIKNVALFKFNNDEIFNRYFYHFLRSALVQQQFDRNKRGGTQKFVSLGNLRALQIPLPPLPEQKRIAAILDKADQLRQKRQQAITLADDFLRSVFLDMFGDPVTNPKRWEVKQFRELGQWTSGGTPSRKNAEYYTGDIDWYSARELNTRYISDSLEKITTQALKDSAAKLMPKGSMFVGMYDTAAFKISILTKLSASNQACANITPNELVEIEWLYSYIEISKEHYLRQRRGVRQRNLNLGMIKEFELPLPPVIEQRKFKVIAEKVIDAKKMQEEALLNSKSFFNSLSQKAFAGEL